MSPADRLVLVVTSPRVAPGLLSWPAWQELRAGHVCVGDPAHPWLAALAAADVAAEVLDAAADVAAEVLDADANADWPRLAGRFRSRAVDGRTAVWLAGPSGDVEFTGALGQLVARETDACREIELQVIPGSYDLPGARLLDVVATMDRLRSPGGCPWDAEQSHESLAPYLVEEAYEAVDAIERGDLAGLRDELGDVLLQVAFHSRLAEERQEVGWTIDDVAAGLVEKLVRRHPHVFADREIAGVSDVLANWETIKAAEGRRTSVAEGVPLGAPALSLAAKLQQRAAAAGLPPALVTDEVAAAETLPQAVAAAAARLEEDPSAPVDGIGDLLFAAVALARFHDVDPEAALRGTTRRFGDRLAETERAVREAGAELADLDAQPTVTEPAETLERLSEDLPAEPSDEELSRIENGPSGP